MVAKEVPDDIKRFILISIPSVPYLEAMLLLRNEPGQAWDGRQVARRLYMGEKAAIELLQQLHEAGIVAAEQEQASAYRYAPESDELRHMIDRLTQTYSKSLIAVTELIHSKTSKKAQHFADAFKWRKDS